MSITNTDKKQAHLYFDLEKKRRHLARLGKLAELEETYEQNISLPNGNTPDFWDSKFSSKHEKELFNPMEVDRNNTALKWFLDIRKKGFSSLNIGCGDGNFEKLINPHVEKGRHTASDITKKTIDILKSKYSNFLFKKFDIRSEKLRTKYDVICFFEVLEHIPPRETLNVLETIKDMLSHNGYFLLSVPMNEGLERMYPYNPNEHLRCYSRDLIRSELRLTGFSVVREEIFYAFSTNYGFKRFVAKHVLKNHWEPNNILILAQKK